jgi:hypothetical protein
VTPIEVGKASNTLRADPAVLEWPRTGAIDLDALAALEGVVFSDACVPISVITSPIAAKVVPAKSIGNRSRRDVVVSGS